jgi:hypothetical protein
LPNFFVSDDVAAAIWKLANAKPFENLSFENALCRVIPGLIPAKVVEGEHKIDSDNLLEELKAYAVLPRRAPTPSPKEWVASIQELKSVSHLNKWKAICNHLGIETAGDSARRKLKKWVAVHRPYWPDVPETGT